MDRKDLEAETHPLRNEDKKLQANVGTPARAEESSTGAPRQPRLSRCRTAAFFLSLFVCLFVVFVVSFIIPCPDRPASQGVWRVDYNAAVTYDFLATEDINRDRIQDVLFLYKNTNGSNNFNLSCMDEGFSSPCTFVAAVSGANGSVLWERPAAQDGALVQCSVPQLQGGRTSSACVLVGRPGSFVAVDLFTGATLWSHPSSLGRNTSVLSSLLQLPDLDADGAPDLLVLTQEEKEVGGYIYSGSTGRQIGHRGSLGVGGTTGSLVHVTRAGAPYVLFPCAASSLCGCSVKGLHETATGSGSPLKRDPRWEGALNASTPGPVWRSPGALRYLMSVPGRAGEDLLLVGAEACVLADGQDLTPRWTFRAAQVFRKPILGHYKPDTVAVVIENGTGVDRQILFLDLSTGAVLWNQTLPSLPGDPQSASLPTADHRSAFFFWGLHEPAGTNQTEPGDAQHSLYMFHPTLPGVLLELANISANIVAFQAVLFEPSRHAACVLLTGPASPDTPGTVSVAKHKIHERSSHRITVGDSISLTRARSHPIVFRAQSPPAATSGPGRRAGPAQHPHNRQDAWDAQRWYWLSLADLIMRTFQTRDRELQLQRESFICKAPGIIYFALCGIGTEGSATTRSEHVCPEAIGGLGGRWLAQPRTLRPIHGSAGYVFNSPRS